MESFVTECDFCGAIELSVTVTRECDKFLCDPCVQYMKRLPLMIAEAIRD